MMLLRGEITSNINLTNPFLLNFKDEGFSKCFALMAHIVHGKITKFGVIQYTGTNGHHDYCVCAFGN